MSRRRATLVASAALLILAACSSDGDPVATAPSSSSTPSTTRSSIAPTTTAAPRFASSIDQVTAEQLHASWRAGCPLPTEELRAVSASHWGFDGAVHQGRIIVHADHADAVLTVLHELFDARYPIERMEPVDAYGGSDEASMDANNTSAFNCRPATGSTSWSKHAYGRAVDLNPLQNPYVKGDLVLPPQSARFIDRTRTDQGVIHDGDAAVAAFAAQGWSWGGKWTTLKDYQHFEIG